MSLFVWQRTITDENGRVVPNAQVEVRDQVSSSLVQLYKDIDGNDGLGNPFNADSDGFARFYVPVGRYRITASVGEQARTWENVRLGTLGTDIRIERTAAEISAGVTPSNYQYEEGNVKRYGATGDGSTDDTAAIQRAFDVCSANGSSGSSDPVLRQKRVYFPEGDYLCNTVVVHGSMVIDGEGWASRIVPHSDIPDGGAVFISLSGSGTSAGDETTNLALLTAVYGSGNEPDRRREYDLSGMQIRDLFFHAATTRAISAIWFTGFTQNALIHKVRTRGFKPGSGFDGGAIRLGGSWVWSIVGCSLYGESLATKEGLGIGLGGNSGGTHLGATSCNSFSIRDNRIFQFSRGLAWRRGSVATITGNDFEFNTIGTHIQSGKNFLYSGNYHELQISRSLELGGSSTGEDNEVRAANITANLFNETSDNSTERVKVRNVQYSRIECNEFKGTGTEDVTFDAGSENALANVIEASSFSRISVNAPGEQRTDYNEYRYMDLPPAPRAIVRNTGAQSINDSTTTTMSWNTEVADVGGWWDAGSPTVFTVPSGVHKVRVTAFILWASNSTGIRRALIRYNGSSNYLGRVEDQRDAANNSQVMLCSAVLPVSAGDTFDVQVHQTSTGALDVTGGNASYFAIEAVR